MKTFFLGSSLALSMMALAIADEPGASPAPTSMTGRGKLLFEDALDAPPGKNWAVAKGEWKAADGALIGAEKESDHHGAVMRHALPMRDVVIQYSFKLDGAKGISLSLNKTKEHLCRVAINEAGFQVRKDDADHDGPDKAVLLQAVRTPIRPGVWHTLVVELKGDEMLASLDGQQVGYGRHDALDAEKANLGLTVAGASAAFKDLRVWEATPNPSWEKTRATLRAGSATD